MKKNWKALPITTPKSPKTGKVKFPRKVDDNGADLKENSFENPSDSSPTM